MLNRGAVIVRPKEPFIEWARGLDDSGIVPDPTSERTIYLVPEYGDDNEAVEVLRLCFEAIFEDELYGWHLDERAWPENRTYDMFRDWFDVEFHSCVTDLCGDPLEDDEVET